MSKAIAVATLVLLTGIVGYFLATRNDIDTQADNTPKLGQNTSNAGGLAKAISLLAACPATPVG